MPGDSVVAEVVKVDLPEPLIYANADEFHVKSTVLYVSNGMAETGGNLYFDKALTKPVYNDKLERLFLAGGLKIALNNHNGNLIVWSPTTLEVNADGLSHVSGGSSFEFYPHTRPAEDSLPSSPATDGPLS